MTLRLGRNSGSSDQAEQIKYICLKMLPVVKLLYALHCLDQVTALRRLLQWCELKCVLLYSIEHWLHGQQGQTVEKLVFCVAGEQVNPIVLSLFSLWSNFLRGAINRVAWQEAQPAFPAAAGAAGGGGGGGGGQMTDWCDGQPVARTSGVLVAKLQTNKQKAEKENESSLCVPCVFEKKKKNL